MNLAGGGSDVKEIVKIIVCKQNNESVVKNESFVKKFHMKIIAPYVRRSHEACVTVWVPLKRTGFSNLFA